jgi:hypothetical protein
MEGSMSQFPVFPAPLPQGSRQVGAFEPVTIYDAPGILAAQLLEDEATLGSIKDLFLSPDKLSPSQRTDLADRFSEGGDSVSKAAIGLVTNPWVWLMFLTSPVGAKALAKGGSLFAPLKRYASQQMDGLGMKSWLKTPLQEFDGTAATAVALGVSDDIKSMADKAMLAVAPEKTALMQRMEKMARAQGGKTPIASLHSSDYVEGTVEHALVKRYEVAAAAYSQGLHRADIVDTVPEVRFGYRERVGQQNQWTEHTGEAFGYDMGVMGEMVRHKMAQARMSREKLEEAWLSMTKEERAVYGRKSTFIGQKATEVQLIEPKVLRERTVAQPQLVDEAMLRKELDEFGPEGWNYIKKTDTVRKAQLVEYVGDEGHFAATGQFKTDARKVRGVATAMARSIHTGGGQWDTLHAGSTSLQGKEGLINLVGKTRFDVARNFSDMQQKIAYLDGEMNKLLQPGQWERAWLPRNTYRGIKVEINGQLRPPPIFDPKTGQKFDATQLEMAPWSSTTAMSERVIPITEKAILVDPDDLEFMIKRGYGNQQSQVMANDARAQAHKNYYQNNGKATMGMRLSHDEMHDRYLHNLRLGTAYDTRKATASMIAADAAAIDNLSDEVKGLYTEIGGTVQIPISRRLDTLDPKGQELVTPGMLMDRLYLGEKDAVRRAYVRDTLVPAALNNSGPEWLALYNSQMQTKKTAAWFADSLLGKAIEGFGETGKGFMGRVRQLADPNVPVTGGELSHGLARWFYMSHLGLNLSSMVLNMTQPLLLAGTVGGMGEIMGAYKSAFLEMADYAKKRTALGGAFVDPAKKLELMNDSFQFMGKATGGRNVLGIGPSMHHIFDWQLNAGKQGLLTRVEEVMMKGFEKTEWFNRNVAAHLFSRAATRTGKAGVSHLDDLHRFVLETQYGASPLNTPRMFQEGVLANPLMRQFFTFPLRSATGALSVFPKLGGEEYWRGLMTTTLRGMGMSAIVYEMGKGLMGADLSRGLYAGAVLDVVGGTRLSEKGQGWLPVPPIVDVPVSLLQGIVNEDTAMLANSVARLIPGGVALNRALGITGEWPQGPMGAVGALQKTWVDWNNPSPDGLFPMYKGDGSLIDYLPGSEIVAKGLGVDMGMFQTKGGLDNYLNKQREDILESRRQYLRAMASNEPGRAEAIRREFLKKHGVPLTVNERQVRDFLESQGVSRTERILDRLPPEVRSSYQQMAAASGAAANLNPGALERGPTSTRRNIERNAGNVDQARMEEMMRRVEAVGRAGAPQRESPFAGFAGF